MGFPRFVVIRSEQNSSVAATWSCVQHPVPTNVHNQILESSNLQSRQTNLETFKLQTRQANLQTLKPSNPQTFKPSSLQICPPKANSIPKSEASESHRLFSPEASCRASRRCCRAPGTSWRRLFRYFSRAPRPSKTKRRVWVPKPGGPAALRPGGVLGHECLFLGRNPTKP